MPRSYLLLCALVLPAVAFACKDDKIQDVDQSVCISGKQWIGGKLGDPRMFPGEDCVGCHLANDGPELMLGGTIYPYQQSVVGADAAAKFRQQQTGQYCFGLEGVQLTITGGDGQEFHVTSNEAGNFFVEGKATDLVKPFQVEGYYDDPITGMTDKPTMFTHPSYGGCARCHTPGVEAYTPADGESADLEVLNYAGGYIGIAALNKDFFADPPAAK